MTQTPFDRQTKQSMNNEGTKNIIKPNLSEYQSTRDSRAADPGFTNEHIKGKH